MECQRQYLEMQKFKKAEDQQPHLLRCAKQYKSGVLLELS